MGKDVDVIGNILFSEEDIRKRAKEIGKQITEDYSGEKVVLLGTLKGSMFWMADVMKNIKLDTRMDFMIASSYGSSTTSSGIVKMALEPTENLYNKNVIIMEDIIDTGRTLSYVVRKLKERAPKSIKICTMLDKPSRRVSAIQGDYVGFEVEDLFVVGYGLDFDQKYRGLPYITFLDEESFEKL